MIWRRFINMLYYGGYLTIKKIDSDNVTLGPPEQLT